MDGNMETIDGVETGNTVAPNYLAASQEPAPMLTPEQEAEIVADINSGRWPYLQPSSGEGPPVVAAPVPPVMGEDASIGDLLAKANEKINAELQETEAALLSVAKPCGVKALEWPNHCDETVPQALRYLADHDRPSGGEQRFNSAHLYQLAGEIEQAVTLSHPAQGWREMDSAPKDGTEFLAAWKHRIGNGHTIFIVSWKDRYGWVDQDRNPFPSDPDLWSPIALPSAPAGGSGNE